MMKIAQLFAYIVCICSLSMQSQAILIKKIDVDGVKRVDKNIVISKSGLKKNTEISEKDIDQATKILYATDLFSKISIVGQGDQIIIKVIENPKIKEIIIKGNKRIDTKTIRKEIRFKPLSILSENKLKQDIRKINDIYIKSGSLGSRVDYNIKNAGDGIVILLINIDEGRKATIRNISFMGNNSFTNNILKSAIKTHENRWYHFAAGGINIYNEDLLLYDQELLRIFYNSQGYFDFTTISVIAEVVDNNFVVDLIFDVYEGERYSFGKITLNDDIHHDIYGLNKLINIKQGDPFNKRFVDAILSKMNSKILKEGNSSLAVELKQKKHIETTTVDVFFNVVEVPKIKLNKIHIMGNTDTKDRVIRRQLKVDETEECNALAIARSKNRVMKSGLFKMVDIYQSDSGIDDVIDLNLAVEEAQTTSINFGAGYDSSQGIVGVISLDEKNFRGMGQKINISLNRNNYQNDFTFGFLEPYLNEHGWSAGFDIFSINHKSEDDGAFKQNKCGIAFYLGKEITDNMSSMVKISHSMSKVYNVSPNASQFIKEQEGKTDATILEHSASYNNFNNPLYPTDGFMASVLKSIALPLSKTKFFKTEFKLAHNKTILSGIILRSLARMGVISGYSDQDVKINNRFFIGMNDIRGFDVNGIGPRDKKTDEALGGKIYAVAKTQLERSINFLPQLDLKWAIFIDTATLFGIDNSSNINIMDSRIIRLSSGIGLSWVSPLGPMRIDYGVPIIKKDFDKTKRMRFTIGWNF
ncbi:outer membrane protein insertion porin family [Candidatus Xenohaliotis californiensis]|uniref:Outer membrane protein assembly factor BamA n=1 Tax=Candidatus Xenohaliotis californiensis TaxID=84677 RepID=A0ABP0EVK9_9RICK|nr:outer membrane protein insertion porin family [Candidatus Xenohaliotis californiensis]